LAEKATLITLAIEVMFGRMKRRHLIDPDDISELI